jgi:hypothetical protein
MGRGAIIAVGAIAFGMLRDPGCGGVDDPEGGPNAPCTRSSDCESGLTCMQGVCTGPDAGLTSKDAGDDGG